MRIRARTAIGILSLIQGLATTGCANENRRLIPSAPSATTLQATGTPVAATSQPAKVASIVGFVVDTAFRPLPGTLVEVVAGDRTGLSATADSEGYFSMVGPFDDATPFRASIADHVVAIETPRHSAPGGQPWIVFYLEPQDAAVDIAGEYTLTLTAATECAGLPVEALTRKYSATLALAPEPHIPAQTFFKVAVHGVAPGITQSFGNIGVAGHELGFDSSWNHDGRPTLAEEMAPGTYIRYFTRNGFAVTSVDSPVTVISTLYDGTIDFNSPAGTHARCESANHRLELSRISR